MNIWHDISAARITEKAFEALIEIPKGCKAKYELRKQNGDRIFQTLNKSQVLFDNPGLRLHDTMDKN